MLRHTGMQVLAETHSDHVLNGVRLATKLKVVSPESVTIHYFDRRVDGDHFVHFVAITQNGQSNGRIDRWPQGFFDQWEQSLDALMD